MTRQLVSVVCGEFEHRQFQIAQLLKGTIAGASGANLANISGCRAYSGGTAAIPLKMFPIVTIRVSALVEKIRKMKLSEIFRRTPSFLKERAYVPAQTSKIGVSVGRGARVQRRGDPTDFRKWTRRRGRRSELRPELSADLLSAILPHLEAALRVFQTVLLAEVCSLAHGGSGLPSSRISGLSQPQPVSDDQRVRRAADESRAGGSLHPLRMRCFSAPVCRVPRRSFDTG